MGWCFRQVLLGQAYHGQWHQATFFLLSKSARCAQHLFQQKDIHLATWVGPSGHLGNQIDYIIVRRADAISVHNCRAFRGTSLESDHRLVRAKCSLPTHCFQMRRVHAQARVDVTRLEDAEVAQAFQQRVDAALQTQSHADANASWDSFLAVIQQAQKELLRERDKPQQDWLTEPTKALLTQKQTAWAHLVRVRGEKMGPPVSATGKTNPGQVPCISGAQVGHEKRRRTPCDDLQKSRGAPSSFGGSQCGSSPNCGVASPSEVQSYGHASFGGTHCGSSPKYGVASPFEVQSYGHAVERARQQYRATKNAARKAVAQDKRAHWKQLAADLEQLFKRGDLHNAYKAVRLRTDACGKAKHMPAT